MKYIYKSEAKLNKDTKAYIFSYGTENGFDIKKVESIQRYPEGIGNIRTGKDTVIFVAFGEGTFVGEKRVNVRKGDVVCFRAGEEFYVDGKLDLVIIEK